MSNPKPKKRVTILGSTGSVGGSTMDVLARHPDRFEVFALTASTQVELMLKQCVQVRPTYAVMASAEHGKALEGRLRDLGHKTRVMWGSAAIDMVASHEQTDIVMAAIVGAAGLAPCLIAARAGKHHRLGASAIALARMRGGGDAS